MNDGFCSTQETKTVNSSKILSIIKKSFSQRVYGDACDDDDDACDDGGDDDKGPYSLGDKLVSCMSGDEFYDE